MNKLNNKGLSEKQRDSFLAILKERFEKHVVRHKGLAWSKVEARLTKKADALVSLFLMEKSGGEPDVIGFDAKSGTYLFVDCSKESPKGRRSTCYDGKAQKARKKFPPKMNALDMAHSMGIDVLDEKQYRELQKLGKFDTTTSSWIKTPEDIRKLGGALFCDRRYETIFTYHNGADSYYAARGFRGVLKV